MSPEAQAALRQAAEVSAEADAVLVTSYARRVPEVDPMDAPGWVPNRAPEPDPVRRSMTSPEQRGAPAAAKAAKPITRKALDAYGIWLTGVIGEGVGKHLKEIRAENRELAQLVAELARRIIELENRR